MPNLFYILSRPRVMTKPLMNGLYIEDMDGDIYYPDKWNNNVSFNSFIVISSSKNFRVHPFKIWGGGMEYFKILI